MALFEKKYCELCSEKVNLLTRLKLREGFLCSECKKCLSCLSENWENRTAQDVRVHLEQREENRAKAEAFRTDLRAGGNEELLADFQSGTFCVTVGRDYNEGNPEIFDFDSLIDFYVEETYALPRDTDHDGIPDSVDNFDNRTMPPDARPGRPPVQHGGMRQNEMPMNRGGMHPGEMPMHHNDMRRTERPAAYAGVAPSRPGMSHIAPVPGARPMGVPSVPAPPELSEYIRSYEPRIDRNGFLKPVSSLRAVLEVRHPFIRTVTLSIDSIISENNPQELIFAYRKAVQLMELCEKIKSEAGRQAAGATHQTPIRTPANYVKEEPKTATAQQTVSAAQPANAGHAGVMAFCPNCGTKNETGGAFCCNCGNSLKK